MGGPSFYSLFLRPITWKTAAHLPVNGPRFGPSRARKDVVEYLLLPPNQENPAVQDDSGAGWNHSQAGSFFPGWRATRPPDRHLYPAATRSAVLS
jgi:hypothetical protein